MVARHDQTTDPRLQEQLLQARRGTAFFARKLNELTDAELDGGSLLPGWTRRHIVAHVGYNARAIARLIKWAATGVETPMYSSAEARNHEIEFGATLSPIALRHLFDHSAVHLNVEWRDLPADAWHNKVTTAQGRIVPAEETVWMRTREVWIHAVDLNNGATFKDVPAQVLERLFIDITSAWRTRGTDTGLQINITDRDLTPLPSDGAARESTIVITGDLADITAWAAGRGAEGITGLQGETKMNKVPLAPKWI